MYPNPFSCQAFFPAVFLVIAAVPWHTAPGRLATVQKSKKSVQKSIRIPGEVWADIESIFGASRFRKMSQLLVYLLEEGVARHLPAKELARRQARIAREAKRREERIRSTG